MDSEACNETHIWKDIWKRVVFIDSYVIYEKKGGGAFI